MSTAKIAEQSRESHSKVAPNGGSDQSGSPLRREERVNMKGAAQYLGLSESTVRKYVSRRLLDHYKVGRLVQFSINDLDAWLLSRKVTAVRWKHEN